ncbi:outer membrane beta-barrel protein [Flavobacterium sp.]|uniref:outer membrane beta-barrel protein n=1 Tax=Flavobacterium sp. TaxID=239 RepID=UPI00286DAC63|nr:outer membrane beta-barrel protein [Flavobacterium sp.]
MKKIKLVLTATILCAIASNAQITTGNWMVGGSGSFTNYKNTYQDNTTETTYTSSYLDLSPNVGYFVVDNFSIGSVVGFSFGNPSGPDNNSLGFGLAPFVRYYFRKSDKIINPFLQASYGFYSGKRQSGGYNKSSEYKLKGGTAFFLNSSVAVEFTIEYNSSIKIFNNNQYDNFTTGIGLQIHLEKE